MTVTVEVYDTPEAVAARAADLFVAAAREAIATWGRFGVALSGGTTPGALYALLAQSPRRDALDWPRVHLFWDDERCVPPDHADSNYGTAEDALLRHVPLDPAKVHRIRGEIAPDRAAAEYESALLAYLDAPSGTRGALDLVLLGLGADGHTASLFPDTAAFRREVEGRETGWVVANHVPALDAWRVTFTTRPINGARTVAVLVTGAGKAGALRQVMEPRGTADRFPAQLIHPASGHLYWIVDAAAAAQLPARPGDAS